jgi:glycosyltransferase involved in cell wall biosynthesis
VEFLIATMGRAPSEAQRAEAARLPNVQLFTSDFRLEWQDDPWADLDAAGDWLLDLAVDFGPDLIHLNGYTHAALPWSVPVLIVAHSCVLSWWRAVQREPAPPRYAEYGARVGRGLRRAEMVIAPTQAMLDSLHEEYDFATPTGVIPNARRPELFPPGKKREAIFSAGRLWDEAKNVALLERIAPGLAWPLYLIGPARHASDSHLGELSSGALARQLATASIYAAPARYEPFGLGILEAALAECALVLSDIPSLRESWHGAALFASPEDDAAWRDALNRLAQDHGLRADLAARARTRALEFSPARMAWAYRQTYEELVAAAAALTI